jgi:hypothetical protein
MLLVFHRTLPLKFMCSVSAAAYRVHTIFLYSFRIVSTKSVVQAYTVQAIEASHCLRIAWPATSPLGYVWFVSEKTKQKILSAVNTVYNTVDTKALHYPLFSSNAQTLVWIRSKLYMGADFCVCHSLGSLCSIHQRCSSWRCWLG